MLVAACAPAAAPPVEKPAAPLPPPPPVVVSAVDAGAPAPPVKASQCKALGSNEVSDDDHPAVAGLGPDVMLDEWLTARGADVDVIYKSWGARHGQSRDDASVSIESSCRTATVGDPAEEAIVCATNSRALLNAQTLLGLVVRNKKPVMVFEVPLGVVALDWPDQHQLDLAFVLHAPTRLEVRERAPDGAVLVLAPSECLAAEKEGQSVGVSSSVELHGCATAKKLVASMKVGPKEDPGMNESVLAARAFVTKACSQQLGVWAWKGGQFVREAPPKKP